MNRSRLRPAQHYHLLEQRRFAAAAGADKRKDFAAPHREANVVMDHRAAEPCGQVTDLDDRLGNFIVETHGVNMPMPSHSSSMEKSASKTITTKMLCTTLTVVWRPTLSALPLTQSP